MSESTLRTERHSGDAVLTAFSAESERRLSELVSAAFQEVVGREPEVGDQVQRYLDRAHRCIEFHYHRFNQSGEVPIGAVIERVNSGQLPGRRVESSPIRDVVLAEAMELRLAEAHEVFDAQYMPRLRRYANRITGNGEDLVGNLAAELILPRAGRPSRIATFIGKTSFWNWLTAVAGNLITSQRRGCRMLSGIDPEPGTGHSTPLAELVADECCQILRPLLRSGMSRLDSTDRLMLKMLILDGIPQKQLATLLNIHSGTLSRRRQRAAVTIASTVFELIQCSQHAAQARECLESAISVSGGSLKQDIATVIACAVAHQPQGPVDE